MVIEGMKIGGGSDSSVGQLRRAGGLDRCHQRDGLIRDRRAGNHSLEEGFVVLRALALLCWADDHDLWKHR